jgi:hypothetical protein
MTDGSIKLDSCIKFAFIDIGLNFKTLQKVSEKEVSHERL